MVLFILKNDRVLRINNTIFVLDMLINFVFFQITVSFFGKYDIMEPCKLFNLQHRGKYKGLN